MKSIEDVKKFFKNAAVRTNPKMDQAILDKVLTAHKKAKNSQPALAEPITWRTIMRSPLTRLAVAASVIVACVIALSLWKGTQSGIALADVLARMEQVKALRYQITSKIYRLDPNKPYSSETHGITLVSQEYGVKTQYERADPNGGKKTFKEIWQLPDKKTIIDILHGQKRYMRVELGDDSGERTWERMTDPSALTKHILKGKHESMGRSVIAGIEAEGFRTTDPNYWNPSVREIDAKIWVDVKTLLPVRYDVTCVHFDNVGQRRVYDNFQWDVPVDPAEFKPVIPDGYRSVVIKYPTHITEEIGVQGLKLLVELLDKYPEKIADIDQTLLKLAEDSETPAALRLKEEIKGLSPDEITNKLADFLVPIRGVARFYVFLYQHKSDPAYYGKTVTPKDADKVLMRWKLSDNEYRVIYGDLHTETVTPERLAELEAALPK